MEIPDYARVIKLRLADLMKGRVEAAAATTELKVFVSYTSGVCLPTSCFDLTSNRIQNFDSF